MVSSYHNFVNLLLGKCVAELKGKLFNYEGEVNKDNKPYGYGVAIDEKGSNFSGLWMKGVPHGIRK